jgi:hypothetical protein
VSHLFERPKKKKAFPDRPVIVRSGGHRHVVVDIDELLQAASGPGGGGGGVPVVDGATGMVVAIAQPDPEHGGYVYVDPRTTVVEEHPGSRRSVAARGGLSVRAVIDTSSPTGPPPELSGDADTPPPVDEAPVTRPKCVGADCFVKVDCHTGFGSSTHINPQPLYNPTNLGNSRLLLIFAGPPKPPRGKRDVLQEVEIGPGMTGPTLLYPTGTDTIFIGCDGSGSVTFRFSAGVAFD